MKDYVDDYYSQEINLESNEVDSCHFWGEACFVSLPVLCHYLCFYFGYTLLVRFVGDPILDMATSWKR